MNQTEKVLNRIMTHGSVDNFWAMKNYILRLGARIKDLKTKGYKIYGEYGKALGKPRSFWKNFYYFLEKTAIPNASKKTAGKMKIVKFSELGKVNGYQQQKDDKIKKYQQQLF